MPVKFNDLCDNCSHVAIDHEEVTIDDGRRFWPCQIDECGCIDFAQPGTTTEVAFN